MVLKMNGNIEINTSNAEQFRQIIADELERRESEALRNLTISGLIIIVTMAIGGIPLTFYVLLTILAILLVARGYFALRNRKGTR